MEIASNIKVALIHDWLAQNFSGGAEKVLKEIEEILFKKNLKYDLYTLVNHLKKDNLKKINQQKVFTSLIQNLPYSRNHFHKYLPLFPFAIEQFDLSKYDLILSSSHSVAKGVITSPDQLHISYIHSPMRYAWDQMNTYLEQSSYKKLGMTIVLRLILQKLRQWDYVSSVRIDKIIANSNFTAKRIKKYWGRDSKVIHPPVNPKYFFPNDNREDLYISVSRLVQNKWDDNFVNEIKIVVGDEWSAGNLSYHLKSRPKWFNILNEKTSDITDEQGVIYTGNPKVLKEICPGVFGEIRPVGYCMIGKR